MKLKLILAGLAFVLILALAGYVKSLIAENAKQKVALDNMAKSLLIQTQEREKALRLSIERQDTVQRLSRTLEETKNEMAALPSSEQYKTCRQADLPDGYNERIRRLRDAGRRERGP
jgi:hypothetical protein